MNKQKKVIIGSVLVIVLLVGGLFGYGEWNRRKGEEANADAGERTQEDLYVTYQGKQYEYNHNLKNILFIGVDKLDEFTEQQVGKGGQSDALILLSTNKEDKTTTLLEISRDSMTDVKTYDLNGEYLGKERAQITIQYAYGDGEAESCQLTKEAVSNLLYEIPISSYLALSIEGVKELTDAVGGVQITVPEDYTEINPLFEKGATLVLNGEQAEQYVRKRDIDKTGSNNERMERQSQFIEALVYQLQGKDTSWYRQIFKEIEEYVVTDMSIDEMERLSGYEMKKPIEVVPGEVQAGEKHDEFIVDNQKLQEMIIKLFYKHYK